MLRKLSLLVAAALFVLPVMAQDAPFQLTILHTNDVHAHHEPGSSGNGGAARQATVVKQIRAEVPNVLLLDGGDRFTGTLFHQQYRGQDSVQIMNTIGYDGMTLGNHEFDDGDAILGQFVAGVNFPVVNANVDFSESPELAGKIPPYAILDVDGEQVGIIGLVTPETPFLSSPGDELVFNDDLVGATQTVVDELTAQGVNKIILVTHIGLDNDELVAAGTTGVDVIVGGHSHSLLSNAYVGSVAQYPVVIDGADGRPVYIVQAGEYDTYLGRLDVSFDAEGVVQSAAGDTILLSHYITPDAEVEGIIEDLAAPIAELKQTSVGESNVFLIGDRTICRHEECNLGDLLTDAMRAETGAQIAIINGGGLRSNVPVDGSLPDDIMLAQPYTVTLGDVLTVLPFGNLTSEFKLSGADVITALENGVSQEEASAGRFPQVSGIRFSWDGSQAPGSRIVSVEVLGDDGAYSALDPEAIYTLASNDFMRGGGDEYTIFETNAIDAYDYGRPLDQVLADYIATHSPVTQGTDGRITRVDAAE